MPFSVALSAAASSVAAFFTTSKVLGFIIKAGILFGASYLLQRATRPDAPERQDPTRIETFTSGPARWIVGRQKVGGVVMFWGEDWDVKGTEQYNPSGGADDLHLVIALSEGELDGIEAVWLGSDRLDVKLNDDGTYKRREQHIIDDDPNLSHEEKIARKNLLPLELDPRVNAYFDERRNHWRETESVDSRRLNPDDEDDSETIRIASLAGSVSIIPYFDAYNEGERWQSLRTYTDDLHNRYLHTNPSDANSPRKATPFADQWTTEHKLQGISGVHVRLRQWVKHNFDERVFRAGTPNISFLVRGIKITHPDPVQVGNTITQWTDNAAAIRYWWHTERRGFPTNQIDYAAFVSAYNACDATIIPDRPNDWPNGVQPEWSKDDAVWGFKKYTINGVVSSGDDPASIENDFDRAWQGQVVENNGLIYYYPGIDRPSSGVVNEADILDYPQIAPAPSLAERINAVTLGIRQSSYHDFNPHSLNEIVDADKRDGVDRGYHAPQDLGEWRWIINPAAAYAIAVINLRRDRHSTTITLRLPPGDDDNPTKYMTMSPGLVYTVSMPSEGIDDRRMSLQSIQIQEDLSVIATFLDSPIGLYESSYELPKLDAPKPYTPSKQGQRPPKPTNLKITSSARTSNDGSVHFRIVATADDHPLSKQWTLIAGDDKWTATTTGDSHTFEINAPRQIMELTVRHIDKTGLASFPVKEVFTPGYDDLVLPTPRWKEAFFHGGTLRMSFEPDEFVSGISGVEIRYTRQDNDDDTELPILTSGNWLTAGELLTTKPVQIVRGQEIVLDALINESGHYNLFARFVSNISGSDPVRGPVSAAREIAIEIQSDALVPSEAAPLWDVEYHNLYRWESQYGNTQGENLMFPAFDPADTPITPTGTTNNAFRFSQSDYDRFHQYGSVTIVANGGYGSLSNDRVYYGRKVSNSSGYQVTLYNTESQARAGGPTGRRSLTTNPGTPANVELALDLDSIPFDVWDGYVRSSDVDAEPYAYWPFGRAPGYDQAFDSSTRNQSTGLMSSANGGDSTWFMTKPIDLGTSKRVEVRAEAYAFAPGTDAVSTITFGGTTISDQAYKYNTAIPSVVMPAASGNTGVIEYALTGLPAGLSFDGSTRTLSGTPTIRTASGIGSYSATDSLGGTVTLQFNWYVTTELTAPSPPTGLKTSTGGAKHDSLSIEWTASAATNYYIVQWRPTTGGSWTTIGPIWRRATIIEGLDAETEYEFAVKAVNGAGESSWSALVEDTTAAEPIVSGTPTGLTSTSQNNQSIALRWNSVSAATTYEVRWKRATHVSYPAAWIKTNIPATATQIDDLDASTTYQIQVRSRNEVGSSTWSAAIEATTLAIDTNAPTVTITSHSHGTNDPRPYFKIVTNTLPGETGTDIEVTLLLPPEEGGNLRFPTDYYTYNADSNITQRTFFYYQNVGPGGTFLIRVRKDLTPRSGIGLTRYSAWNEQTITFAGVPRQPPSPRARVNDNDPYGMQITFQRQATATRYRIRYWPEDNEGLVLQQTRDDNDPDNTQLFLMNLINLADDTTYKCTLEAYNSYGWSLTSPVTTFTLPKYYQTPAALTGLQIQPLTDDSVILGWDEQDDVTHYEVTHDGVPTQTHSGITDNSFVFGNLQSGGTYRFSVRAYQQNVRSPASKYGPWTHFTQMTLPPASHGINPYPWGRAPLTFAPNPSNPRRIDWTFVCPKAAGVVGLQVRYALQYEDNNGVQGNWVIGHDQIFTVSFANDGDTFTGSFDPGLSNRVWVGQVRLLIGAQAGILYDAGFTNWAEISNSATLNNGQLRSFAYRNGVKPMTAPTPSINQQYSVVNGGPRIYINFDANTDDFETPNATDGSSRNEIRISYRGRVREIPGLAYPVSTYRNYRPWSVLGDGKTLFPSEGYTKINELSFGAIRRLIGIQPYYEINPIQVGEQFGVQIVRYEKNRPTVSSPIVNYTVLSEEDAGDFDPDVVTFKPETIQGRDVTFHWNPSSHATQYEVRLFEDNYEGAGLINTEGTVVQESGELSWTKTAGINEHFYIEVRARRGSGNNIHYSAAARRNYAPQDEIGKITNLRITTGGEQDRDLIVTWKALPGDNDDFRYERSFSDDNGVTWTTPFVIPTTDWSNGEIEHTMANYAHADTVFRLRAFKYDTDGTTKIYSHSYTTAHWTPTGTIANGSLNPINVVVAGSRSGRVFLDWKAPEFDTGEGGGAPAHPEATRYRIHVSSDNGSSWTHAFTGIAGSVTSWDLTGYSVANNYLVRIRPETYDLNGTWVVIPFTADTAVSVGQVNATGEATYTTMTANWTPTSNAQSYELQYKAGSSGFSGAGINASETTTITGLQGTSHTITGLEAGTHYQMRLRGVAGTSTGAYSPDIDIDTLITRQLPAPAGVTLSTAGNNLRISWAGVTDATGYHVRIDAKPTTESTYTTYQDVVVRNYSSTTLSVEINRLEFGQLLSSTDFDLRVRIKSNFYDSPNANYSAWQSIRWEQGVNTAPPGGDNVILTPGTFGSPNSITNPHLLSGVNGIVNLAALPRSNEPFKVIYFQYNVAVAGTYTFRMVYTGPNNTVNTGNQLRLSYGTLADFATASSDTTGAATITTSLPGGTITMKHYLAANTTETPSSFTLQISGPIAASVPFRLITSTNDLRIAEGSFNTFTTRLSKAPLGNTTITFTSNNDDITFRSGSNAVSTITHTFTSLNWQNPYSLDVYAAHDGDVGNDIGAVTITGPSLSESVLITVIDDDTASIILDKNKITLEEGKVSEGGGDGLVNVKLGTQPTSNVTVRVSSDNSDVSGNKTSLTFTSTNWNVNQSVQFSAEADPDSSDETATITFAASGGGYNNISTTLPVDITDTTSTVNVSLSATTLSINEGNTANVNVRLTEAISGNVVVNVRSNNSDLTPSPSTLTFTSGNWSTNQRVTLTAAHDSDGSNESGTITFRSTQAPSVNGNIIVTIVDDEVTAIVRSTSSVTFTSGSTGTFTLRLSHQPTGTVTLNLGTGSSSGVSWSPTSINFTTSNWNNAQTISLTAPSISARQTGTINITASGGGFNNVNTSVRYTANVAVQSNAVITTSITRYGSYGFYRMLASSTSSAPATSGTATIPSGYGALGGVWYGFSNQIINEQEESTVVGINLSRQGTYTIRLDYNAIGNPPTNTYGFALVAYRVYSGSSWSSSTTVDDNRGIISTRPTSVTFTYNNTTASSSRWLRIFIVVRYHVGRNYTVTLNAPSGTYTMPIEGGANANSAAKGAIANGTGEGTAERISLNNESYSHVVQPTLPASVLPTFNGNFPAKCWTTGVAIDNYQIPPPIQGLPPYRMEVEGLPDGLSFDEATRTISGTPTQDHPLGGEATITLSDANGNTEIAYLPWAIAGPVPSTWSEFSGGIGQFTNPFEMTCTTKGPISPFFYIPGGTNAQAIIDNDYNARYRVMWMKCPTTFPHTARLIGADAPDYDLIIKVGDDWYVSDTPDSLEMLSVPGHSDGAIIGVYRYEPTTTSDGLNNTGDLTLEWFPNVEHLPTDSGGAVAFDSSGSAEIGANETGSTPGTSETDIYVLHRNSTTGTWTRSAAPISGWVPVGVDARQIRFEVHLKKWQNRALRRFTSFYRDEDT